MTYAEEIQEWLVTNANTASPSLDDESGSSHIWYRVRVPIMRQFVVGWCKVKSDLSYDEWVTLLEDLYHGDSIEERTIAGMLLVRLTQYRSELPLETLGEWLGQLEGWKEVDSTCQSTFTADELLSNWDGWQQFLRKLNRDENINKRRASLVLLVNPLRNSDDERLVNFALEQIESLKHEKDKLITKAISWLLRTGIKRQRVAIATYLAENVESLPSIAVREVRKKLETGRK